nr:hypothetical protein [uncultured Anaerosporobacter sp.]
MLDMFSYFIIPVYTILLARQDSLFDANLSIISSDIAHKDAFMLWAFMIVAFIYLVLSRVISNHKLRYKKLDNILVVVSCVLLLLSATTPFLPDIYPVKAELHVVFAFTSTVVLLLAFLLITWELHSLDKKQYNIFFILIIIIGLISFFLFIYFGMVTGFLEVFITITGTIMAKTLYDRSKRAVRCTV